jgi:hypothetical protein
MKTTFLAKALALSARRNEAFHTQEELARHARLIDRQVDLLETQILEREQQLLKVGRALVCVKQLRPEIADFLQPIADALGSWMPDLDAAKIVNAAVQQWEAEVKASPPQPVAECNPGLKAAKIVEELRSTGFGVSAIAKAMESDAIANLAPDVCPRCLHQKRICRCK